MCFRVLPDTAFTPAHLADAQGFAYAKPDITKGALDYHTDAKCHCTRKQDNRKCDGNPGGKDVLMEIEKTDDLIIELAGCLIKKKTARSKLAQRVAPDADPAEV